MRSERGSYFGITARWSFKLLGTRLDSLSTNTTAGGVNITDLAYFNKELIIGTRTSGLFKLEGQQIIPWGNDEVNTFLVTNELNKIYAYGTSHIAFGTIKGGVLILDTQNQTTASYYRGNGLENNTVLALHESYDKLWVGLDNGLDQINLQSGISYYREKPVNSGRSTILSRWVMQFIWAAIREFTLYGMVTENL